MTTHHSITLKENALLQHSRNVRSTRVSKTRQYGACVVATVTARTVEKAVSRLLEHEAEIKRLRPLVEAAQKAAGGISVDEANVAHNALTNIWYTPLFENEALLRKPRPSYGLSDAQRDQAIEMTEAQGFQNPYKTPAWTFLELERELRSHELRAKRLKDQNVQAGQQMVLSWHRDAGLAQKRVAQQSHYIAEGYALEIRTDIEVTSK
jgi:hypothetical protein